MNETLPPPLLCSFCGKSQFDVRRLIKGRGAAICDGCLLECVTIVFNHAQMFSMQPVETALSSTMGEKP